MQQINKRYDFGQHGNVINVTPEMGFDERWMNDEEQMMKYIRFLWKRYTVWTEETIRAHNNTMTMIEDLAIKTNNLSILEMLWQSVYYNDRDNPPYFRCLLKAARYSNIKTFLHCLYAYENYAVLDMDEISYQELVNASKDNSKDNPKIAELVEKLKPVVVNGILPSNYDNSNVRYISDISDDENSLRYYSMLNTYLQIIKEFCEENKYF